MATELIPVYTSIISAVSALFGSAIGYLSSYFVSKNQIRATVLSGNRQQWINTLRDCIAEFQTQARIACMESDLANNNEKFHAANLQNHDQAAKALIHLKNKIILLINPNEKDHEKLINYIKELEYYCFNGDIDNPKTEVDLQDKITSIGQKILKREWERVKIGD